MKFLSSYLDFIFEAVAKKEMRLHYSPKFRELIKRMAKKNTYANFLLMAEDSNQISDIYTLIDVTDKNDTISFIQVNRILRAEPETKKYTDEDVYFLKRNITNDMSNDNKKIKIDNENKCDDDCINSDSDNDIEQEEPINKQNKKLILKSNKK